MRQGEAEQGIGLVADVGGTHVRFALAPLNGALDRMVVEPRQYRAAAFTGIIEAAKGASLVRASEKRRRPNRSHTAGRRPASSRPARKPSSKLEKHRRTPASPPARGIVRNVASVNIASVPSEPTRSLCKSSWAAE